MTLQEQIADLVSKGIKALAQAQIIESMARDRNPKWNPFDIGLNALTRPERQRFAQERYAKLGMERFISGEAGEDIFEFKTRREASTLKPGFGNLVVKKEAFNAVLANPDRGKAVDNIAAMMQYTNSTIMMEQVGDTTSHYLSKNAPSEEYLRSQAENIYDMVNDKEKFAQKLDNALYIDIETSGLDDQAGVWQVAMKSKEGGVEDVRMQSHLMDQGVYITEKNGQKRLVSFKEYMRMREGGTAPTDDIITGFSKILKRINEADTIVGQNVSFDLEKLLRSMEGLRDLGDDTFNEQLDLAKARMLGDKATIAIVDTRQLSAIALGADIPSATADIADFKTYSQENIALQTDLLDRMKKRMSDPEWDDFLSRLQKSGLHDASVDITVTEHIARSILDGSLGRGGKEALDKLAPGIWESLQSSAIVPTATKLKYGTANMTPLEALIRGTSSVEVYSFDAGKTDSMFRAGSLYDWRQIASASGITEQTLGERQAATGASGFLNHNFARDITLDGEKSTPMASLVQRASSGRTVQEAFHRTGVAFAGLSEPERVITSMLSSGNIVGNTAQLRLAETTRGAAGGMYFKAFGRRGKSVDYFQNVAINPELIAAYEKAKGKTLGNVLEHGRRAARISTVAAREGQARATVVLDLFKTREEALEFASGLSAMKEGLSEIAEEELSEGQRRILNLLDDIDNFDELGKQLSSKLKYGVQIGQFEGENVEAAVRTLDQLFPGRDVETVKMGTVIEGLDPSNQGTIRTTAAIFDVNNRLDDKMLSNVQGAFKAMHSLEKHLESRFSYVRAQMLSSKTGGKMSKYVLDNPKTSVKALSGTAAIAGLAFLFRDNQKDQRLEEPFRAREHETARDYEQYKASIGEYPEPGFQSFPRSTHNPLEMSGAVQYLHDTKTRRHQMGANKNAHLFGL